MVEVKAAVKRGANTLPAYLMFLSGTGASVGGLTASHSREGGAAQCLQQGTTQLHGSYPGMQTLGVTSFKGQEGPSKSRSFLAPGNHH